MRHSGATDLDCVSRATCAPGSSGTLQKGIWHQRILKHLHAARPQHIGMSHPTSRSRAGSGDSGHIKKKWSTSVAKHLEKKIVIRQHTRGVSHTSTKEGA